MGLSEEEQKKTQEARLQLNGGTNVQVSNRAEMTRKMQTIDLNTGLSSCEVEFLGCRQEKGSCCSSSSCCQNPAVMNDSDRNGNEIGPRKSPRKVILRVNSGKGAAPRNVCAMPMWIESWEHEDTYAAAGVVCAAASVGIAYSCYKHLT